jgi:colanic acid biosynthesis protein WcaH
LPKIPDEIFNVICNTFAFASIDLLVMTSDGKFILTKRAIEPDRGLWHIPGSIIAKGERVDDAIKRIARDELGVKVSVERFAGLYEYIGERHYLVHLYIARLLSGRIVLDFQASEYGEFDRIPRGIVPLQRKMLRDLGYSAGHQKIK